MQIILFLLEVVIVAFLLDLDALPQYTKPQEEYFSSYSTLDAEGDNLLLLKEIPEDQKLIAWMHSPLKEETALVFPHIEEMTCLINNRIKGDETFKKRLIEYIENIHGQYLAQEISYEEFRRAVIHPDPALPAF